MQTLLELYKSNGLTDIQINLKLALEKINTQILKQGTAPWKLQKLNEIKKLIESELIEAYGGLYGYMQEESVAIANISNGAILGSSLTSSLPKYAMEDLMNSNRQIQGYSFKELFQLTANNHARQLRRIFSISVGAGMTPEEITRELSKSNTKLSKGQLTTNVRTVIFDSLNQGTYNAYTELEKTGVIDYYEHVSVLDSRTSSECQSRDGRKYYMSIKEINEADRPLIHFLCRSKLIARTDLNKNNDNQRASQFGSVPDEPYPAWFKKQDPSFQRTVLGAKKYELYKNGTFEIKSLPDVYGRTLSVKQIQTTMEELSK